LHRDGDTERRVHWDDAPVREAPTFDPLSVVGKFSWHDAL